MIWRREGHWVTAEKQGMVTAAYFFVGTEANVPESWAVNDSPRFPDIIVQADPGCAVISSSARRDKITPGDHGWPPEMDAPKTVLRFSKQMIRTTARPMRKPFGPFNIDAIILTPGQSNQEKD